jgi:TatA/E family protein of Tat protein translocase
MFSIPHLIVIFVVALVVFGPEKIPELARNLGKIMAEFRRVTGDLRSTFEGHLRDLEREADTRRIAPSAPSPAAGMMPTAAPAAVPATVDATDPQSAPASPGTVPSNPPNAAAIADSAAKNAAPAAVDTANELPDPMHDPYLMHMDFPPRDSSGESKPPEPEPKPERVTDGDRRIS